jgi:biopolymer transport protein ExbD
MAMDAGGGDDDEIVGINVTPLVDVCLVLVIIFMVTAPLMSDPVIKVTLPKAHADKGEESDKLTLTLSKDGDVALDFKIYTDMVMLEDDLKVALAQSQSKVVILRADEEALHGRLTELMAKAKDAGALSLTIATEQKR